MEIRPLRADDDRSAFGSGNPDLDRFLEQFAGQNQFRQHIGVTYVAVEADRILGYVTVASGHLEIQDLPQELRKHLPRYPAPILRLSRMATDASIRGQGLGKALLAHACTVALEQGSRSGCISIVVDAKPEAVSFYQNFGFLELEVTEGESYARPTPVAMILPISDIAAAAE